MKLIIDSLKFNILIILLLFTFCGPRYDKIFGRNLLSYEVYPKTTNNSSILYYSPQKIIDERAIVKIKCFSIVGSRVIENNGTGFIFYQDRTRAFVLTANHVVRKSKDQIQFHDSIHVKIEGKTILGEIYDEDNHLSDIDLTIIELKSMPSIESLKLGFNTNTNQGDDIYILGFPGGGSSKKEKGTIEGFDADRKILDNVDVLEEGFSGAPLIHERLGTVIGIIHQKPNDSSKQEARSINTFLEYIRHDINFKELFNNLEGKTLKGTIIHCNKNNQPIQGAIVKIQILCKGGKGIRELSEQTDSLGKFSVSLIDCADYPLKDFDPIKSIQINIIKGNYYNETVLISSPQFEKKMKIELQPKIHVSRESPKDLPKLNELINVGETKNQKSFDFERWRKECIAYLDYLDNKFKTCLTDQFIETTDFSFSDFWLKNSKIEEGVEFLDRLR